MEQQPDDPQFAANLAACAQFGIAEPVASELSRQAWVNPRYIEAHVLSLQDWETRGLLDGDPMPDEAGPPPKTRLP